MPVNNGFITAPIGFGDIQTATGTQERDLGKMILNAAINKWAKYKPVRQPALFTDNLPNWWKSIDLNCGINYPVYDNNALRQLVDDINAGVTMYNYLRPYGTNLSPYRTTDFNNYFHNANPPIFADVLNATYARDRLYMPVIMNALTPRNGELSISDLYGSLIDNFYFGVAMVSATTVSGIYYMTSSQPITGTVARVDFTLNDLPRTSETWWVYQFLARRSKPTVSGPEADDNTFIPVPADVYRQQVRIIDAAVVVIDLSAIASGGTISVSLRVTNESGQTANFTNCTIQFRYWDSFPDEDFQVGEGQRTVNNFSVQAGGFYQTIIPETQFLPAINTRPGYVYFTGTRNNQEVMTSRGEIQR